MATKGWIGVDLDGTLAHFEDDAYLKNGHTHIGEPVPEMLERVKRWLAEGKEVRIFTARAYTDYTPERTRQRTEAIEAIHEWCYEHLGRALEVTCVKDYRMVELWDDRAVTVERNTGKQLAPSQPFELW